MTWRILSKSEKAEIENKLKGQFGINEIPGLLVMIGKERIFFFSGDYEKKDVERLGDTVPIERVGVYFAKKDERTNDIRLSIEGAQILQNQIKKNIFELPEEYLEDWMKGRELQLKTGMYGFVVIKFGEDILGTGKASEEKISNFIPKNRRLKERS